MSQLRCVCASMKPGDRVASPKSITSVPDGTRAELLIPAILSPSTTTLELRNRASDLPSKIRAALITMVICAASLVQITNQHTVPQVGGIEALGEPVVSNRRSGDDRTKSAFSRDTALRPTVARFHNFAFLAYRAMHSSVTGWIFRAAFPGLLLLEKVADDL